MVAALWTGRQLSRPEGGLFALSEVGRWVLGLATGVSAIVGLAVRTGAAAVGFGAYLAWASLRASQWPSFAVDRWLFVVGAANTGYLLAYYAALVRAPVSVRYGRYSTVGTTPLSESPGANRSIAVSQTPSQSLSLIS